MGVETNLIKTPDYNIVHGFWPETENFYIGKKITPWKNISQREHNDTNFGFIAPSSEE